MCTSTSQIFQLITTGFCWDFGGLFFVFNGYAYSQIKSNDVRTMAHKNWRSHNLLPQLRATRNHCHLARNTCGICTVQMLAYTSGLQVSGLFIVLHVFSVYTDDYFQSCKIPDLKISWSQAPLVHGMLHWKSIPFFQDVFKYPIYKRYQPLVGFLFPSSLTIHI